MGGNKRERRAASHRPAPAATPDFFGLGSGTYPFSSGLRGKMSLMPGACLPIALAELSETDHVLYCVCCLLCIYGKSLPLFQLSLWESTRARAQLHNLGSTLIDRQNPIGSCLNCRLRLRTAPGRCGCVWARWWRTGNSVTGSARLRRPIARTSSEMARARGRLGHGTC